MGDRLELHRLFTNLIGNAIKFTDTGSVTIRITPATASDEYITVEVADTGPGIPLKNKQLYLNGFAKEVTRVLVVG
jgi:signal transduction histidine kinase